MTHFEITFLSTPEQYSQRVVAKSEKEKRELIYQIEKRGDIIIGIKPFVNVDSLY